LIGKGRFGLAIANANLGGSGNLLKRVAFAGGLKGRDGSKACEEKAKY
jgi:hypothetical protein